MAKTANLYARIEPEIKEQAEIILDSLGIPASNAIAMFYKQIILNHGIPFELKLPAKAPLVLADLTEEGLNRELMKGYADITNGNKKAATEIFDKIQKDYCL
ncbi:type II toxin-antitoxin system RelB/DinJ family antitoxin [uncultured Treponema sp.]|uniref:type II toxin-antitoxin system RelB/DinJ family antitoxin n=1 Tax=uncultured Treponema sp. TaxID=162155 RepID=UPI0028E479FB|nr:type II toxin-antitoxin system RelB/DinJ family antitoxin [uncultured Treponema sp.]